MSKSNFEKMIQLSEEIFSVKNDPNQLSIDEEVMQQLTKMHPNTISKYDDGNGPVSWVLLIPTSIELMNQFISNKISEKDLFEKTPLGIPYEALYLCSAITLTEYRNKGITKKLITNAIDQLLIDFPIKTLFVWSFTKEGDLLSDKLALHYNLPLLKK